MMKKFVLLLGLIICLFSCWGNDYPYRIVQMENEEYVIQHKVYACFGWKGSTGWRIYTDASGSYRFKSKLEASKAYARLIAEYQAVKNANKVKKIIK